ncbi:Predicted transcriptional regulators [Streptomyces sp. SceaMP-e96]|uniref:ArsR/SmtB family transcription factor n=1 Tax=unclassified Streptomyces TaxID=2593676 RepID=UPI0008238B28|nr:MULTISPECIES: winged helix-turn-helix domain-containing protein [unclassified Streptomyces]MYT12227.1 ArsR family transcriptional regulator [Streptomyces sp. SID4951]SCK28375.1 Predicted transcriptional regulators [Streptomyces sp. SceaMP-e96]
MNSEELLALLSAVGHAQRLRVIGELADGRLYVSELARRLGMSRPLLYMHLDRLEKAGLVVGRLELSEDGKALKYFELAPFELKLNVATVLAALQEDRSGAAPPEETGDPGGAVEPPSAKGPNDPRGTRT